METQQKLTQEEKTQREIEFIDNMRKQKEEELHRLESLPSSEKKSYTEKSLSEQDREKAIQMLKQDISVLELEIKSLKEAHIRLISEHKILKEQYENAKSVVVQMEKAIFKEMGILIESPKTTPDQRGVASSVHLRQIHDITEEMSLTDPLDHKKHYYNIGRVELEKKYFEELLNRPDNADQVMQETDALDANSTFTQAVMKLSDSVIISFGEKVVAEKEYGRAFEAIIKDITQNENTSNQKELTLDAMKQMMKEHIKNSFNIRTEPSPKNSN